MLSRPRRGQVGELHKAKRIQETTLATLESRRSRAKTEGADIRIDAHITAVKQHLRDIEDVLQSLLDSTQTDAKG